jgi:hypothetical protein
VTTCGRPEQKIFPLWLDASSKVNRLLAGARRSASGKVSASSGHPEKIHTEITHGDHPRSSCFCRTFQCLAVPRQPLKLLETLEL